MEFGAINNKVRIAQKNHHPECAPIGNNLGAGCVLKDDGSQAAVTASLMPGEFGKVHFLPTYSMNDEFKPSRKLSTHVEGSEDIVSRGKKFIAHQRNCSTEIQPSNVRRIPDQSERRSDSSDLPCVEWTRKKTLEPNVSKVYDMEAAMNRKQRVKSQDVQRNYIPQASGGDKFYYAADREPGFYKSGGLISGSTIQMRRTTNSVVPSKLTSQTSQNQPSKLTGTFADKLKTQKRNYDIDQVACLNNSSMKLGQAVPSWEERTGLYLIRPEDEKY